jgi:phosphatidylglycerol lysyltransferase
MATLRENLLRWLLPAVSLVVFTGVALVIHHELAGTHLKDVLHFFRATPPAAIFAAGLCTAGSYWLLGLYDVLGLRYVGRQVAARTAFFTAFIANAFGHNLGVAAFTGAAVRYRIYGTQGLNAADVATLAGFCSVTTGLGIATLAGAGLIAEPQVTGALLHLHGNVVIALGAASLGVVAAYAVWSFTGRAALEIRGWSLRPPRPAVALPQIVLAIVDLSLAAAVPWLLLPADASIGYLQFAGIYAIALVAGVVSHVPGGIGVFEAIIVLALPGIAVDRLLGALLAWRLVYYFVPLVAAALLFAAQELANSRRHLKRFEALAAAYITPIVPQVSGSLAFFAGFVLLVSGATPALDTRIARLVDVLPLGVLEASHLVGSVVGLALVIVARALFRRIDAACQITLWLLGIGVVASLLKGLDIEEALLLLLVMGTLWLGRSAFYRRASIIDSRFTPAWIASLVIVMATTVWIGFFAHRHVEYANSLWWTFAVDADAPRMLRASLLITLLAAGFLLTNLLRPARAEPGNTSDAELVQARQVIATSSSTLPCVVLTGDKRLLFHEAGDAFLMYQISGRSWIALGDPVGPRERHEELVWRFRELSDQHGGWSVFYQVGADRLPLYVDLGLSVMKLGEEARVSLADFSLEGSARAELRTQRRRAEKDGASFEVVMPAQIEPLLPLLRQVSDAWLEDKATAEKGFSVGQFTEGYVRQFPVAIVRTEGSVSAFATLWVTTDHEEITVDLMRFGPDAPRAAMDYLFVELLLWAQAQGYRWLNIGMAPLSGLEKHPLAPVWHRVGNFVFRYGEHFYNFEGLRRYKSKFNPVWEPRYLVAPGGLRLPRILLDVSVLIAGGVRELFAK